MTKKHYRPLPALPPPSEGRCFYIPVPDDDEYFAIIMGAIADLSLQSRWARDPEHKAKEVARFWERYYLTLIGQDDLFPLCYDEPVVVDCEAECYEFMPEAGFIRYLPNDPFRTPNFTPAGYTIPPFYHDAPLPIFGVQPTDAMVNGLALPVSSTLPEAISSGLPRIQIAFSGRGQVEVTFVKVPQGGLVYVYPDGNPLVGRLIDLNSIALLSLNSVFDLVDIAIAGGLTTTTIDEWDFETTGEHTLDVLFLPNVDENIILGFGGGIRDIEFCGSVEQGLPHMPAIQLDGCMLQWKPTSEHAWVDLGEVCGQDGQDGIDGDTIDNVVATTLASGSDATASYDDETNTLYLGIPAGANGIDGIDGENCDCDQTQTDLSCRTATALTNGLYDHINDVLNFINIWESENPGSANQDLFDGAVEAFGIPITDLNVFYDAVDMMYRYENDSVGEQIFGVIDLIEDLHTLTARCWLYCHMSGSNFDAITRQAWMDFLGETFIGGTKAQEFYYAMVSIVSLTTMQEIIGLMFASTTEYDCSGCVNCDETEVVELALYASESVGEIEVITPALSDGTTGLYRGTFLWVDQSEVDAAMRLHMIGTINGSQACYFVQNVTAIVGTEETDGQLVTYGQSQGYTDCDFVDHNGLEAYETWNAPATIIRWVHSVNTPITLEFEVIVVV